jgi:carbon-monoxide dehydrogenase catalytic subunit
VLETVGIPPVLHVGSCVDNSRILTVLSEVVEEGGLGEDISDLPAVGICPEWFSEKAIAIATYCVASGAYVIFGGVGSPVAGSLELLDYMITGWNERVGGKLAFIDSAEAIVASALDHIDAKRAALKIDAPRERVLFDMDMRRELDV